MLTKTKKINKVSTGRRKRQEPRIKEPDMVPEEEHKYIENDLARFEHKDNDFCCGICLNYIVAATSTKCGHTFCEMCL